MILTMNTTPYVFGRGFGISTDDRTVYFALGRSLYYMVVERSCGGDRGEWRPE
ncbi:hypothetical protein CsatB_016679 [Cannabis sativa]